MIIPVIIQADPNEIIDPAAGAPVGNRFCANCEERYY